MIEDDDFKRAMKPVRLHEGGNDDDPQDRGGRTSRGITQREYNAYCTLHDMPMGDVWEASEEDIAAIYYNHYWMPYCPEWDVGLDYLMFDCNVLHGPKQANLWLQRCVGVEDDGVIGPMTLAAVKEAEQAELIQCITRRRLDFFRQIKGYERFGRGWTRRAREVGKMSVQMAVSANAGVAYA